LDYRDGPPGPLAATKPADKVLVQGAARESADLVEPGDEGEAAFELRSQRLPSGMHGERLDKALVALAPEFSRSHLQHLIELGHVQVDGVTATTASRRVRAGQALRLELVPTDESRAFRPEAMALATLYEDEHLLVLDKPAGLVVHPAPGHWSGTLLNGLLAHHAGAAQLPRAGIVHRLDKDTSGVMMVGKTLPAVTALVRDMAARDVHRRYLALAHGVPQPAEQTIDAPIGRDPRERVRMAVIGSGKPARTDVRCLASTPPPQAVSALSCTLHTGRTHQIRVHLAWRGHPLVADAVYGGRPALGLQRQALHATELRLAHPISRAPLAFRCPPPPDFAAAWQQVAGELGLIEGEAST
jgi:23S rRNA pseudouridine1911/1915/1917 synthase